MANKGMKFRKVENVPFFSKYVREDGKIIIESTADGESTKYGYPKSFYYKVSDSEGNVIEFTKTMKEAKKKYSE